MSKLTRRQRDVVRLLIQGKTQKEIARELNLRYGYVRQVTMAARSRGECRTTAEMTVKASQDQ